LNSFVLIFRESKDFNQSKTWKESFKLLSIQSESAIIKLLNESTKFRFILLKSYYQSDDHTNDELSLSSAESSIESSISSSVELSIELSIESSIESTAESQNNFEHFDLIIDFIVFIASIKRDRDQLRKFSASAANFIFNTAQSVVSSFIASRQKEIVDLLEKEIFISINKKDVSTDVQIFSFRFVNEIKDSGTEKTFEKFRLVIQTFNDQNETLMLTQSSIIQRVSQRLIICLAVSQSQMKLYLRNITQIYVQFRFNLNRNFYVQSSFELIKLMKIFSDCILKMIKL
jgi:hypothetical protein